MRYVSLKESVFDELVKLGEIQHVRTGQTIDGKEKYASQSGEFATFRFGGNTLNRIPVSRSGQNTVGIRLLSMFDVYLDVSGAKIALKPNERFGKPVPRGRTGIGIEKVNSEVVVSAVFSGTAAEREAIEIGSGVISIDGTNVLNMELYKIKRLMRKKVGEILILVLEKDGKRFTRSLVATGPEKQTIPSISTKSETISTP